MKNKGDNLVKSEIKLTIGMLVSNHIPYIRKAMEALKPLLEAVPSELIVVDTKGVETDGSIAVVREYTDKIYPFTWCNDFSAARNVCMEHARGEWFLYADDDEWFDDVTEFIEFFQSGECENYQSGFYYTRDYAADGSYSTGIAGRMIRRRENTHFVGKVHETFNMVYEPNKQFNCFTHHYGYAFQTREDKVKHCERNISILKGELVRWGIVPRLCAQMMQELMCLDETIDAALSFGNDALERIRAVNQLDDSCSQWVMVGTVRCYSRKQDLEGAKRQAVYIKENYELNEISKLVIAGTLANLAAATWALEDMIEYGKEYLYWWNWKEEHPDLILQMMNLDIPKFLEESYYQRMVLIKETAEKRQKEQTMYPKKIESEIKLTIGMLVSNHIQYIRKAMEALKPLLDAVSSELVVLDTMGDKTDGSIQIVREYTDRIYPFTWCNDFSAARNALLDHARGEWFLYVDDDEWFDDVTEFIEFFKSGECDEYFSGYYYTRDYLPNGGYSMGIAGRMIRRMENTRFVGRVHETFNEVFSPNKQFNCFTHHYGYAYETEEDRKRKQRRNLDILEAEIKEEGLTPKRGAQHVQELLSNADTMEEGYQKCMEYIPQLVQRGELENSCTQWLLAARVRSFADRNMHEALAAEAVKVRKEYTLSQTADLAVSVAVIFSATEVNDFDLILSEADRYFANYDWREANPEEALLQTQLDFPRFYADNYYHRIVHLAAIVANYKEEYERANNYWKRIPWKKEGFDTTEYQGDLSVTVQGLKALQDRKIMALQIAEQQRKEEKKKEFKVMLQTLLEAGEYTKASVLSGKFEELGDLLSGMQEMAITIGQAMDETFGEGTEEVSKLEEYCECVWQCSQAEEVEPLLMYLDKGNYLVKEILEKE
ncbi:MAG: glycosyltransferase [Lachnospiraceae bacterium]|nr:glycosyltransferase [Lachnospiraceae bacterium]